MNNKEIIQHLPGCNILEIKPCPSDMSLFGEPTDQHHWSGWPGAYCLKCGDDDKRELCLADSCKCVCHKELDQNRIDSYLLSSSYILSLGEYSLVKVKDDKYCARFDIFVDDKYTLIISDPHSDIINATFDLEYKMRKAKLL